jgi:hypothetical protein
LAIVPDVSLRETEEFECPGRELRDPEGMVEKERIDSTFALVVILDNPLSIPRILRMRQ